jgi:hypothetical protein
MFFRGLLGRGLVARYGLWGVLLTAVLFGLVHYPPALSVPIIGCLGAVMHGLYLTSRSIFTSMTFHLLYNCLVCLWSSSLATRLPPRLLAYRSDWVVLPCALAAFAALAWLLYRTRVRWRLPGGDMWTPGYLTAEMPPAEQQAHPESSPAGWPLLLACAASWLAFATAIVLRLG